MAPPDETGANEFDIIARHFAPLAAAPGARGLIDDAALLGGYVVTTDAIVEGVHFLPDDPLDLVARKALRVNLSDLAAKGARPLHYLLTLAWPKARSANDIATLAAGLAQDQAEFGVTLLGGDTVSTPGPLTLSITALGAAGERTPARAGAMAGDDLWVTGSIGDAGLGLAALRGGAFDDADYLIGRYRLPQPRVDLATPVAAIASAAMDVSDGLLADAAKLAEASGVAIDIDLAAIPVSAAAARWLEDEPEGRTRLAGFGDDYEILFAASPAYAAAAALFATRIGGVRAGQGARLLRGGVSVPAGGYVHAIGR